MLDDGSVSHRSFGALDDWRAFLISATGFHVRSDTLRNLIIQRALRSSKLPTDFSEKDFKSIVYQMRSEHEEHDQQIYKVAFPIWGKPNFLTGKQVVGAVTLNFSPSRKTKLYKKITLERAGQRSDDKFDHFFTDEKIKDLDKCFICLAHVRAINANDANEQASEAVYQVLGLINLAKDANKTWRRSFSGHNTLPVSEVLIGPHTTTHLEDGSLTHDGFWYEKWSRGPRKAILNHKNLRAWEKRYSQLASGLAKSKWKTLSRNSVVRYYKAFSNPDLEEAFLDGWRLFENMAGSQKEKSETLVTRTSNMFEESIEFRIKGKHLAHRRNLVSHGRAINVDDQETLAFQILNLVIPFLERFILNSFSFKSPEEFWEFLDLPDAVQDRKQLERSLRKKLNLLTKAALFRGEAV
ncbi:hypothetical protein PsAD13_03502 [Pseudovibrio sp. Ad13]|uniref:hypothetical protein n=1 Tax=Pseudovibrio sp. Ad13 TaxID=989396 RepID=UPI0007AEA7C8|nr:hypothetical protein [Pseudovibrio sp. Ad13]KZK82612.1 hypothetical protein PsAD13_03502 [Pseudovibrio sp. Ad13]